MGLFDRSSSSTTNLTDNRSQGVGGDGFVVGDGSTIHMSSTDYGAVDKALQLTADNLSQSSASQDRVLSAAAMGLQAATGEGISSSGKQITTAIIVAGVVALIWVIKR
jgi:hypothetical protein